MSTLSNEIAKRYEREDNDPRPADDGTGRLQAWMLRKAEREAAEDREYEASPEGRLHRLQVEIDAAYAMQTDQGIDATERAAKAQAEIDAIRAAMAAEDEALRAEHAAEWTPEVTAQRRAVWNALVKSGTLNCTGKYSSQISPAKVADQERKQGWTADELRAAVARLAK